MGFVARSKKKAFMETEGTDYSRMRGFTSLTTNKNALEYTRQYVDENFETTDIVGMSTSMDFEFDQMAEDPVHEKLVSIIDEEKIGDEAIVSIVVVDFTQAGTDEDSFVAIQRDFAVIPESEGDGTEAYQYSGTFRVKGDRITGEATSIDNWETIEFTEGEVGGGVEG